MPIALFCGSRKWTDRDLIGKDLIHLSLDTLVVHGGAPGADTIADEIAHTLGLHTAVVVALWDHYGRGAGPLRNQAMLTLMPDEVYAYPLNGSGTRGMIALAVEAGIRVHVRGPTET